MRALSFAALLIALAGCSPTIAEIDGTDDPQTDDPSTEPPPPPVSVFAGTWSGAVSISASFGGQPQVLCQGELVGSVDDDGVLTADGTCPFRFGPNGQGEYVVVITGSIEDEGPTSGTAVFTASSDRMPVLVDTALEGTGMDNDIVTEGIVPIRLGMEIEGTVVAELHRP